MPGRLSIVSIIGGTIFAALSGSTIASTAMLGSVLLPEMDKRGYHPGMSMGPIMAVGGIVPGIIMSVLFIGYVVIRCALNPSLAPSYDVERLPFWQRWQPFVIYVLPLSLIFVAVLGAIFAGIASPTDFAAFGALMSAIIAACNRRLTWQALKQSLMETGKISVMILFIVAALTSFSQILAFSGATDGALQTLLAFEWTPLTAMVLMLVVLPELFVLALLVIFPALVLWLPGLL